jgi:glycogen debranching enzyme
MLARKEIWAMTAEQPPTTPDKPSARRGGIKRTPPRDPYYIQATSALADEHRQVLKEGETFAVFDHYGDVKPVGLGEEGIYHEGTRFLSCLQLGLGKDRPLFLSSTVKEDNDLLVVDLTNPDLQFDGQVIPRGTLHLSRTKFLWEGACYERLHLRNYGLTPLRVSFTLHYEVDFADIFEVRGTRRKKRGEFLPAEIEDDKVVLAYEGLDGIIRRTRLRFNPKPAEIDEEGATFQVALPPQGEANFFITLACEIGERAPKRLSYESASKTLVGSLHEDTDQLCQIDTSNEQCNAWLRRTAADLHMMVTQTPEGPYPYAGVPWFSTPFGRDGIITALECLWLHPGLARGVLGFLAAMQATEVNPAQDAEPGKILHELRKGEMVDLGEIPFGKYYGSIDATPLFIMLAAAYFERTSDRVFIESLWPHIERALHWIDVYGDKDRDGFVEYQRQSTTGLQQQGWKDSQDAVFHADGALAQPPIALCEVQGYVYAAWRGAAELAQLLGQSEHARRLLSKATGLQERFEQAFWCDDLSTYALALDGEKRPCRVRTSNAGHCLFTGIASPAHARRTAQTLLDEHSFSGWGIRTVAGSEARYNPMSYHNGSIWPHDNALIAGGLARYGLKEGTIQLLGSFLDASHFLDLHRMPELFCGFPRRPSEGPTLYPVACAPQAWAAASVYLLLQACLGLHIQATEGRIAFNFPVLPDALHQVRIKGLRVGKASVDLLIRQRDGDVAINVLQRKGTVEIVMVK